MDKITEDSVGHKIESGDEQNVPTTSQCGDSGEDDSVIEVEPVDPSIGDPPKPAFVPAKLQSRKPPKIPVGRANHKHLDELFKSLNTTRSSRQFFDTKVDEFIAAIKADQPNGEIRRGQPHLFFAAQDFTKAYGQEFWSFLEPEVDDDELHVKLAQYFGDRNALYRSKKTTSTKNLKRKSNTESQPSKAPKVAQNAPERAPKRPKAKPKDTTVPPTCPRNEGAESEASENEEARIIQTDEPTPTITENRQRSVSKAVSMTTEEELQAADLAPPAATVDEEVQADLAIQPSTSTGDALAARTLSPSLNAAIDLRIKFKHPDSASRARTKIHFPLIGTYETFFPGIVGILSKRHQEAAIATAGEVVYSWDEENALEMRKGEVGDWNAFVDDLEERWTYVRGEKGDGRVKVYFDLRG